MTSTALLKRSIYLPESDTALASDLARAVDLPTGAVLRRLVRCGLDAVRGDPGRLFVFKERA